MKEIKGTVRMYPATGRVVQGAYIKVNDVLYRVKNSQKDRIITDCGSIFRICEVKLHKLYVVSKSMYAELHYSEYDKVKINKVYKFKCEQSFNRVSVGDKVTVFKYLLKECFFGDFYRKRVTGTVINIVDSDFTIELIDGNQIHARRHGIELEVDKKWIARLISDKQS
jgi:hypothetical protein